MNASKDALIAELKLQGITQPEVLNAILTVPREKFVLRSQKKFAYDNTALPIDCKQTISQPYIVALMTQALYHHPHPQKILEIGTGSGYQAAILGTLFKRVYSVERIPELAYSALNSLQALGLHNIEVRTGDGTLGWSEAAPFDGIIVTCATPEIPQALVDQLSEDRGVLIIPIGHQNEVQKLTLVQKQGQDIKTALLELVRFVPLISK